MYVSCSNCNSVYQVSDELIPEQGRTVQCSNCQNVFFAEQKERELPASQQIVSEGLGAINETKKNVISPENNRSAIDELAKQIQEAKKAAEAAQLQAEAALKHAQNETKAREAAEARAEEAIRQARSANEAIQAAGIDAKLTGPETESQNQSQEETNSNSVDQKSETKAPDKTNTDAEPKGLTKQQIRARNRRKRQQAQQAKLKSQAAKKAAEQKDTPPSTKSEAEIIPEVKVEAKTDAKDTSATENAAMAKPKQNRNNPRKKQPVRKKVQQSTDKIAVQGPANEPITIKDSKTQPKPAQQMPQAAKQNAKQANNSKPKQKENTKSDAISDMEPVSKKTTLQKKPTLDKIAQPSPVAPNDAKKQNKGQIQTGPVIAKGSVEDELKPQFQQRQDGDVAREQILTKPNTILSKAESEQADLDFVSRAVEKLAAEQVLQPQSKGKHTKAKTREKIPSEPSPTEAMKPIPEPKASPEPPNDIPQASKKIEPPKSETHPSEVEIKTAREERLKRLRKLQEESEQAQQTGTQNPNREAVTDNRSKTALGQDDVVKMQNQGSDENPLAKDTNIIEGKVINEPEFSQDQIDSATKAEPPITNAERDHSPQENHVKDQGTIPAHQKHKNQNQIGFWGGFMFILTSFVIVFSLHYLSQPIMDILPQSEPYLSEYNHFYNRVFGAVQSVLATG